MPPWSSAGSTGWPRAPTRIESFHIGRLAVADEHCEPVVVDWRAPVAEPFYRATGREPMGLRPSPPLRGRGPHAARPRGRAVRRGSPRRRRRRGPRRPRSAPAPGCVATARCSPRSSGVAPAAGRHRRHHPGRAGRDHPLATGRRARRAGRSRHGQDRGRAAPRRVPAVHVPVPARGPGRARHRAQPGVPALHRAGAAVARRGRRRAGGARRPRPRRQLRPARHRPAERLAARVKGDIRMSVVIDKAVADRERPLAKTSGAVPHRLPAPDRRGVGAHRRGGAPSRSAATTPLAGGSRARSWPRWPSSWRGRAVTASDVREGVVQPARGARGARADVAGADAGRAAARPVRLAGAAQARRRSTSTTTSTSLYRPRCDDVARRALDRLRRRPARRGPRGARARRRRRAAGPTRPTRSARTATSSSTRCRTSRRCSCGWRRAVRSTAR